MNHIALQGKRSHIMIIKIILNNQGVNINMRQSTRKTINATMEPILMGLLFVIYVVIPIKIFNNDETAAIVGLIAGVLTVIIIFFIALYKTRKKI